MNKKSIMLIIFFIIIFVIIIGIYNYILYLEKLDYETINYEHQSNWVKEVYEDNPNIFEFDISDECKITVEQMHTIQHKIGNYIEHDKYGNMCVGYFIIKKKDKGIEVDSSHICDMINY